MKVIVAHPFQQHSFKTAVAVKTAGHLFKYVTTVYQKEHSLTRFITKFLSKDNLKRANGRKCSELNDDEVVLFCEWANLILLLLQRIDKSRVVYKWWYWITIKMFNSRLYSYIKRNSIDAIIVYDTLSSDLIVKIKKRKLPVKIILDMSAPNAMYMRAVFLKEVENDLYDKDIKTSINKDYEKKCINSKLEIELADLFLVASNFTKDSLLWQGVQDSQIIKCIYGVYETVEEDVMQYKFEDNIKCCILGKICLQKGAYRLLNVIQSLKRNDMEFHFFGGYDANAWYSNKLKKNVFFHGHIPHIEMLEILKKMDVIIFPSFADGFGLSVTEALCRNNIAICSKNAGVAELIEDGVNGYTYNPDDEDQLLSILESLNKINIRKMQRNSMDSIKEYTWENYNRSIAKAIELQ